MDLLEAALWDRDDETVSALRVTLQGLGLSASALDEKVRKMKAHQSSVAGVAGLLLV